MKVKEKSFAKPAECCGNCKNLQVVDEDSVYNYPEIVGCLEHNDLTDIRFVCDSFKMLPKVDLDCLWVEQVLEEYDEDN